VTGHVRVWRLRKDHTWIDAHIRACAGSSDVEIQFFYDGTLLFTRRWPSREQALTHAADRLRDLQRVGWTTHW
jgi:hypothetical protein